MNFYIENSMDEINIGNESVEFSEELIGFIYKVDKYYSGLTSIGD